MIDVQTRLVRAAGFTFYPLPVLGVLVVGSVDDDMFAGDLGDGFFDLLPGRMVRECLDRVRDVLVGDHASFVRDGFEKKRATGYHDFRVAAPMIPAKLLDEQWPEIEILQMLPDLVSVEG